MILKKAVLQNQRVKPRNTKAKKYLRKAIIATGCALVAGASTAAWAAFMPMPERIGASAYRICPTKGAKVESCQHLLCEEESASTREKVCTEITSEQYVDVNRKDDKRMLRIMGLLTFGIITVFSTMIAFLSFLNHRYMKKEAAELTNEPKKASA